MKEELIVVPIEDNKGYIKGYKIIKELIRCKDCIHRDPEDRKCDCGGLERAGCIFPVDDDYFCSYGERREE